MLNEPASARDDRPYLPPPIVDEEDGFDSLGDAMQQMVAEVLEIEEMRFIPKEHGVFSPDVPPAVAAMGNGLTARFVGRLRMDSEEAFDRLDAQFATIEHVPLFREDKGKHVVLALEGRPDPQPRDWRINLGLFVATLFSVLLVGLQLSMGYLSEAEKTAISEDLLGNLWRGLPYALSIMLILGAHELGHYFAARRHNLSVTLPYFMPLPFITMFGTLGAFIQLRQPMKNRKVLLDFGVAGPLAGLIFAVPILFIGLATAEIGPPTVGPDGITVFEGDSLLYAFAKTVTFGEYLPNAAGIDVYIDSSQLAWAGWTGLLVSALNLIPLGQLDGGHIMYALFGERARLLYYPLLLAMIALAMTTQVWLIWVALLFLLGRVYATPLDMITPLNGARRAVGIFSLVVFLLIFVPMPLMPRQVEPVELPEEGQTVQIEPIDFDDPLALIIDR